MPFNADQDSFLELATILRNSPEKVVFVIGTGLTYSCAVPWDDSRGSNPRSWRGLVENGLDFAASKSVTNFNPARERQGLEYFWPKSREDGELNSLDDFLSFIGRFQNALGPDLISQWLTDCFQNTQVNEKRACALHMLTNLASQGATLVTTNYDQMIETASGGSLKAVTPGDAEFVSAMTRPEKSVIHIHGTYDRDQVLGNIDYAAISTNKQAQALLQSCFVQKHVVYIGCGAGLEDPNFGRLLSWLGQEVLQGQGLRNFYVGMAREFSQLNGPFAGHDVVNVDIAKYENLPGFFDGLIEELDPKPFKRFKAGASILDTLLRQSDFDFGDLRPSLVELESGALPNHPVIDDVLGSISRDGVAAVLGRAGAGKTTLALQVAQWARDQGKQVYWLTMRDGTKAFACYQMLASRNRLFILDDAHLDASAVREIVNTCLSRGDGGSILVVATYSSKRVSGSEYGRVVHHRWFSSPSFMADIAHYVLHRLKSSLVIPDEEAFGIRAVEAFGQWSGALAIALSARLEAQVPDPFNVHAEDAKRWVGRKLVLGKIEPGTQAHADLVFLASLASAKSEKWVPVSMLPREPGRIAVLPDELASSGLVVTDKRLAPAGKVVRLYQPLAMGKLILETMGAPADSQTLPVYKALFDILMTPGESRSVTNALTRQQHNLLAKHVRKSLPLFVARSRVPTPFQLRPMMFWMRNSSPKLAGEYVRCLDESSDWSEESLSARDSLAGGGLLLDEFRQVGQPSPTSRNSEFDAFCRRIAKAIIGRRRLYDDCQTQGNSISNLEKVLGYSDGIDTDDVSAFLRVVWNRQTVKAWLPRYVGKSIHKFSRDSNFQSLGNFLFTNGLYRSATIRDELSQSELLDVYSSWLNWLIRRGHYIDAVHLVGGLTAMGARFNPALLLKIPVAELTAMTKGGQFVQPIEQTRIGRIQRQNWLGLQSLAEARFARALDYGFVQAGTAEQFEISRGTISRTRALLDEHMRVFSPVEGQPDRPSQLLTGLRAWLTKTLHRSRHSSDVRFYA